MEVAVCIGLTGIWWILSLTFLLPLLILLKCSKSVSNRWFAFLFSRFIFFFDSKVLPLRKKAFKQLKESLSARDASNALKVLEIGIGSGINLQYYPENSHLTALDANASFETYFRSNQKKYQQVVYERTVTSFAEDMREVDDCSKDVVITTYVLCSVNSTIDVLKEVKRVLKPGGRYLFMEHVGYPRSHWGSSLQQMVKPLWAIYFGGCCLMRNIADDIKNAGFSDVSCENIIENSLIMFVRPHIYGIAIK